MHVHIDFFLTARMLVEGYFVGEPNKETNVTAGAFTCRLVVKSPHADIDKLGDSGRNRNQGVGM